ncbi:hypothetical protein F5Y12DRAFT_718121 [Xylaria sp. FL1777]|nr:hypothetical protein F5Y12DRAFT_718121 [Xylaria sp. FL1777]
MGGSSYIAGALAHKNENVIAIAVNGFEYWLMIFDPCLSLFSTDFLVTATTVITMSTTNPPAPVLYNISLGSASSGLLENAFIDRFDEIFLAVFLPYLSLLASPNETSPLPATIPLSTQGCQYNGTTDCAEACMDPGTLFGSTKTLYDCSTLAIASSLLQNGSLLLDNTSMETANQVMEFGDLGTFNGSTIIENVADCVSTTCQNTSLVTCSKDAVESLSYVQYTDLFNASERIALLYLGLGTYCDNAGTGSDPDIAGPGASMAHLRMQFNHSDKVSKVTVSYIIQCAIVLLAFVIFKVACVMGTISKYSDVSHTKHTPLSEHAEQEDVGPQPQAKDNTKSTSTKIPIYRPIGSIMADFQETQAILVATVQVATLVYFNTNALVEAVDTFSEAIANQDVIRRLSFDGVIPVLLGQIVLQRAHRHWWYTTFLTTLVFSLGIACNSVTSTLDYAALWAHFKDSASIEACGGNPSPATYCFTRVPGTDNLLFTYFSTNGFLGANPVSWVRYWAIFFILVDQMLTWLPSTPFGKRLSFTGLPSDGWLVLLFWRFPWFVLQLILFFSVFPYVVVLYQVFSIYSGGPSQWTFGQFIAVMVWVPLGAKLVYSILFGVEKGVENRVQGGDKQKGALEVPESS